MRGDEELRLKKEIRRLEEELYQKHNQLSSIRRKSGVKELGSDKTAWKREFDELIRRIGELSTGGDSVEDIRQERDR